MPDPDATARELRCPVGPQRLFGIYRDHGQMPPITDGNLIEFSRADCRRSLRTSGTPVAHVLHRFDLAGVLVESEIVSQDS